jgi:3'-phosphoadenosine 5'-phosphosulfate (PAPS) 3'-phosphatase
MNNMIQATRPTRVERVAGSGNKFIHMIQNKSDYYLNLVPGFKNWDMCGSEAILAARFGLVTDAYRRPFSYDSQKSFTLKDGIIAAKSKEVFDTCNQRIEESQQMSMD